MAGGTISISTALWEKKLAEYIVYTKSSLRAGMDEEWPLLMKKVVDFTPPFKTGGAPGASDLSVGRAAVDRDIQKTMMPFDPKLIRTKSLQKVVDSGDIATFNIIAARSKDSRMNKKRAVKFSPEVHTSQRNARGRVGRDTKQVVLGSDVALLKKHVADVKGNVGSAKAGWRPGIELVGGKVPAYVKKQTVHGTVIDERDNPDNPSITAINRTRWAVRKDEGDRIVADAKRSRTEAIRLKIAFKMREAAKKAKLATKAA